MYDNGTVVNGKDTIAWTLAIGDNNAKTLCSNVTNNLDIVAHDIGYTTYTKWDETAGVRYSLNDTDAKSEISDYVWVQVELNIPQSVDAEDAHTGSIYIHFKSD